MIAQPPCRLTQAKALLLKAAPDSVLKFPEGVSWLGICIQGMADNELYVRACFEKIIEGREEYIKLRPKLQCGCDASITGTSGIPVLRSTDSYRALVDRAISHPCIACWEMQFLILKRHFSYRFWNCCACKHSSNICANK